VGPTALPRSRSGDSHGVVGTIVGVDEECNPHRPLGVAAAELFHLLELLCDFRFALLLASCGTGHLNGLLPGGNSLGMLA
jgi:hypothetical protein